MNRGKGERRTRLYANNSNGRDWFYSCLQYIIIPFALLAIFLAFLFIFKGDLEERDLLLNNSISMLEDSVDAHVLNATIQFGRLDDKDAQLMAKDMQLMGNISVLEAKDMTSTLVHWCTMPNGGPPTVPKTCATSFDAKMTVIRTGPHLVTVTVSPVESGIDTGALFFGSNTTGCPASLREMRLCLGTYADNTGGFCNDDLNITNGCTNLNAVLPDMDVGYVDTDPTPSGSQGNEPQGAINIGAASALHQWDFVFERSRNVSTIRYIRMRGVDGGTISLGAGSGTGYVGGLQFTYITV